MNIPVTAPQVSRMPPMPAPKPEVSFIAVSKSMPVTSQNAANTDWAQL